LLPQLVVSYRTILVAGVFELVFWYDMLHGSGKWRNRWGDNPLDQKLCITEFFVERIPPNYS